MIENFNLLLQRKNIKNNKLKEHILELEKYIKKLE